MAGLNKKITKDRYNHIKSILNLIPAGKVGVGAVYDSLGIASGTACYIRKSKDYNDYINIVHKVTEQKKLKNNSTQTIKNINVHTPYNLDEFAQVFEQLNRIEQQNLLILGRLSQFKGKLFKKEAQI